MYKHWKYLFNTCKYIVKLLTIAIATFIYHIIVLNYIISLIKRVSLTNISSKSFDLWVGRYIKSRLHRNYLERVIALIVSPNRVKRSLF